jgi:hypothetical protein
MGESVMYEEHLDEVALEERNSAINSIRLEISIYAVIFISTIAIALLANGFFIETSVALNGCWLDLDKWSFALASLAAIKCIIQCARLLSYKRHNQESIVIHIGGNYILMPILTLLFFALNVYLKQIPYPVESNVRGAHY